MLCCAGMQLQSSVGCVRRVAARRAALSAVARTFGYSLVALASSAALVACSGDPGWNGQVPAADAMLFQSTAYPVLMRDCAFSECHGSQSRFFQIYGPGRTRLDPTTKTDDPATAMELQVSYLRSVSMLIAEGDSPVTESLLLKKPLEASAGGVGHRGVDDYGRNVYATPAASGYQALLQWAQSGTAGLAPNIGAGSAGGTP